MRDWQYPLGGDGGVRYHAHKRGLCFENAKEVFLTGESRWYRDKDRCVALVKALAGAAFAYYA